MVGLCPCSAAIVLCLTLAVPLAAQTAPEGVPTELFQDNVVIVLDASGSMDEPMSTAPMTKMQAAKQALLPVLDKLPETTNVGLVVFSARNLQTDWVYPLGRVDKAALRSAVMLPEPGGNTPLGAYLKVGTDALLRQREAQHGYGSFRLLVVSDGEASDPDLVTSYLPDVLTRGITVDVIGVDMDQAHALATRVHSYRRADSAEELEQALTSVFAEVGSDQDDALLAEQFELIQPLPAEMADRMLAALTTTGNHPIGEVPASGGAAVGATPGGTPAPVGQPGTPGPDQGGSNRWMWGVLALVVAYIVLRGFLRKAGGGRRP
jgi:hypothetical protein